LMARIALAGLGEHVVVGEALDVLYVHVELTGTGSTRRRGCPQ
jgi:hypothetical protein